MMREFTDEDGRKWMLNLREVVAVACGASPDSTGERFRFVPDPDAGHCSVLPRGGSWVVLKVSYREMVKLIQEDA